MVCTGAQPPSIPQVPGRLGYIVREMVGGEGENWGRFRRHFLVTDHLVEEACFLNTSACFTKYLLKLPELAPASENYI